MTLTRKCIRSKLLATLVLTASAAGLSGCPEKTPAEKMGDKIENAGDEIEDAIDEAD